MAKDSKQTGKGTKIAFAIGGIVIIALLIMIIVLLIRGKEEKAGDDGQLRNVLVTQENAEEVYEEMKELTPEDVAYYTVTQNGEWHFTKSDEASYDAYIENSSINTTPVYFDLFLAEDESEAIYESPVIPVGESLSQVTLNRELERGTHNCVVVYHLIDEEQNTLSTLRVTVKVTIEE